MKNSIFLIFVCFLFAACSNDPCEDINCGANGTCNEATETCDCDQYYEGDRCQNEVRAKFVNNWTGTGVCDYNPQNIFNLNISISKGLEIDVVKIQSTSILQEFTITGMLDASNDIVIPEFQPHISANTYDGKITMEGTTLVMTLHTYVNGVKNTCVYTFPE